MKVTIECTKIQFADMVHRCEVSDCERCVLNECCGAVGAEYLALVTGITDPEAIQL